MLIASDTGFAVRLYTDSAVRQHFKAMHAQKYCCDSLFMYCISFKSVKLLFSYTVVLLFFVVRVGLKFCQA